MSENTQTPYDEMAYNDLKKLAAERGLNSSGTKDELKARLVEADGGTPLDPSADPAAPTEPAAPAPVTAAPVAPAPRPIAPRPAAPSKSGDTDVKMRTKAQMTKAHLDKQPKVMVFIPFEQGENPKQAVKIKFHVSINGYSFDIPRGTAVQVPEQVAQMVAERLESEGKAASRAGRIDDDPAKQEALSDE